METILVILEILPLVVSTHRAEADDTYTAVWEAGQGPDGKRRRKSKSGFLSREEAQEHIDLHAVVTKRRAQGRSEGYVERRPSKKLGNFVVKVYLPRAANGRERTRVLSRWKTRKEAEAALRAFSSRTNDLRQEEDAVDVISSDTPDLDIPDLTLSEWESEEQGD
tara:strand:- start:1557 stop:2051 length:495 start_codon:yes stop_codon:yes gene_type:complete